MTCSRRLREEIRKQLKSQDSRVSISKQTSTGLGGAPNLLERANVVHAGTTPDVAGSGVELREQLMEVSSLVSVVVQLF